MYEATTCASDIPIFKILQYILKTLIIPSLKDSLSQYETVSNFTVSVAIFTMLVISKYPGHHS